MAFYALRRRMMLTALVAGVDVAALAISYTGTYQDYGVVQMTDGAYRLLAFTDSGTLTMEQAVNCEVCVVGGGAEGLHNTNKYGANDNSGGAGGYLKNQIISNFTGGAVVVGAAQGASSIGEVSVTAVSGKNGGTGGGGARIYSGGTGDGLSKYPFGDTNYTLWAGKPHCGGGGGGVWNSTDDEGYGGGAGGTNGSSGSGPVSVTIRPGVGGSYGGGKGGNYESSGTVNKGDNATYYGSGGGGGAYYSYASGKGSYSYGGSGYQGIVYLRIPVDQAA